MSALSLRTEAPQRATQRATREVPRGQRLQAFLREFYINNPFSNLRTLYAEGHNILFRPDLAYMKRPHLDEQLGGNCYYLCEKLKDELVEAGFWKPEQIKFILEPGGEGLEGIPHAALVIQDAEGLLMIDPTLLHSDPINLTEIAAKDVGEKHEESTILAPGYRLVVENRRDDWVMFSFHCPRSGRPSMHFLDLSNLVDKPPEQDDDMIRAVLATQRKLFIRAITRMQAGLGLMSLSQYLDEDGLATRSWDDGRTYSGIGHYCRTKAGSNVPESELGDAFRRARLFWHEVEREFRNIMPATPGRGH